jgi:hypothetical protein
MFLLMVGAHGSPALAPPRGPTANILQLSGSHSQTSGNASQGPTMSRTFLNKKKFRILTLLRTWKGSYRFNYQVKGSR